METRWANDYDAVKFLIDNNLEENHDDIDISQIKLSEKEEVIMKNIGELVEIESSESNSDDNSSDDAALFNKSHLDSLLRKKKKMTRNEETYSSEDPYKISLNQNNKLKKYEGLKKSNLFFKLNIIL